MNETIESLASNETAVQQAAGSRAFASYETGPFAGIQKHPRPRRPQQRWSSSLSIQDLQCLLQVIESDVIPQLLSSFSPARHARVQQFDTTG